MFTTNQCVGTQRWQKSAKTRLTKRWTVQGGKAGWNKTCCTIFKVASLLAVYSIHKCQPQKTSCHQCKVQSMECYDHNYLPISVLLWISFQRQCNTILTGTCTMARAQPNSWETMSHFMQKFSTKSQIYQKEHFHELFLPLNQLNLIKYKCRICYVCVMYIEGIRFTTKSKTSRMHFVTSLMITGVTARARRAWNIVRPINCVFRLRPTCMSKTTNTMALSSRVNIQM
jgi:hypothetical protein